MAIWTALAGALTITDTITAQIVTGTSVVNGTAVAVGAYEGDIIIHASALSSTADTLAYAIEESYDGSTSWAAVPSDALVDATGTAATLGTTTDAPLNTSQVIYLKKERVKAYIRATVTATGSGISIPVVVCVIGQKKYANI